MSDALVYAALTILAVLFSQPFACLVVSSLKPSSEIFGPDLLPSDVAWENYRNVFSYAPVARWLLNTVLVSGLAVVSVLISSTVVAYGFARLHFRGRSFLFGLLIASYMLPSAVTLIPTFLIWNELGMVGTFYPLWAGNLFGSAFYIFMLRQFFRSIPQDLIDSARLDGAGYFRILVGILVPLLKPALTAVAVFEFQAKWNDFLGPLIYLNERDEFTLALGLASFKTDYDTQWGLWMAASVILTIPMVVLFFLAQKFFMEGLASTTGLQR
jgi:multiple sugar transport system permease protein